MAHAHQYLTLQENHDIIKEKWRKIMEWQPFGYEPITTFWQDFTIAEIYGDENIEETTQTAFSNYCSDVKYLTELIMVLNHKCWYWYEHGKESLSKLYETLFYEYDNRAIKYLEEQGNEEDIRYFFSTLD